MSRTRMMENVMKCGRYGHVQAKCPDLKRKVASGSNKNKSFGSWSDEDVSEPEEIANLCFMTILENDINKLSGCWTDEDVSDDECKDENENCFMARGEKSEEVLQEEFQELQMQLNGMRKSTSHSSVKSNQATYKSTEKGPTRTESTSTSGRSKNGSPSEHHRKRRKEKWYLDSACSSHMTGDKNLFKEVTKINGGSVKFGDDSKGKIVGTGTFPFNNNCDITEVYLVNGLNYNLLSINQLCDSEYEVKFKKIGCAIEDESGYSINSRSFRVYNKCTLSVEESVHIVFDENNTSAEKGTIVGDGDQNQETTQSRNLQESTNRVENVIESTGEISNSQPEAQIKSTTPKSITRPNEWRSEPEYPQKFIVGDPSEGMKTRGAHKKKANLALISQIEPKKIDEALKDSSWVQAMQKELDQFDKNQVWKLMPKPTNATVIGTKWVFRNKLNEDGKVIRNKARLVVQ
ncbi:uncharacterized protein [Nicotiana tomentosiformis]|uniref:uncharacterized protein n=1 Tax=Nicotiana tomentosiformis TaxID=4098 RepID=UPI000878A1C0